MVSAYTTSFPLTKESILLINFDSSGNVLWSQSAEGESTNWAESMIATSDGGFLTIGDANNSLTTLYDIEVIKFNDAGAIEWAGLYAGADSDYSFGVAESRDGSYIWLYVLLWQ